MARSLSRGAQLAMSTVFNTLDGRENVPVSEIQTEFQSLDFAPDAVERTIKVMSLQGYIVVQGEGAARTLTVDPSAENLRAALGRD